MTLQVRLKNLEALFPLIQDNDSDGLLSAAADGGVADAVCVGNICTPVTRGDLSSWQSLDAFLERVTGRRVSFVFRSFGDVPAYLAYSRRGGEALEGVVDWQTGQSYRPEKLRKRFAPPDVAGLKQDEALAAEECSILRRRSQREACLKEVQETYADLYAGAAAYTANMAILEEAYDAMNADFLAGSLVETGVRHYLLTYYRIQQAERARSLSLL